MRIVRTYLNIITAAGEFHALDAKGEIERSTLEFEDEKCDDAH